MTEDETEDDGSDDDNDDDSDDEAIIIGMTKLINSLFVINYQRG